MLVAPRGRRQAFQVTPVPLTIAFGSRGARLRFSSAFRGRRRGPAQASGEDKGGGPKSSQRLREREPEGPPLREERSRGRGAGQWQERTAAQRGAAAECKHSAARRPPRAEPEPSAWQRGAARGGRTPEGASAPGLGTCEPCPRTPPSRHSALAYGSLTEPAREVLAPRAAFLRRLLALTTSRD